MDPLNEVVPLPSALADKKSRLEPFEWFDEQRGRGDLHWDGDREFWDVFAYNAAERVLSRPDQFSNAILDETDVFHDSLLGMDPPIHSEHRRLVEGDFTPAAIRAHESDIRGATRRLLAAAIDGPTGSIDCIADFARPLPLATIAHVLGIEEDLHRHFAGEEMDTTSPEPPETAVCIARHSDVPLNVARVLRRAVQTRDREGGPIRKVIDESDLDPDAQLRFAANLLVAGHLTTTNLIANAVRCLANRPDALTTVREAARTDAGEILDRAVEETLRFRSPIQHTARVATEQVVVSGREIEPGDRIVVWLLAANRDPAVFDDPATFDPTRDPNPNMAFGRGPHVCLGAHLARLEARVALEELFRRVETLELVETTYEPVETSFLHGVDRLPVRYEVG